MSALPEKYRYQFATDHSKFIKSDLDLNIILSGLPINKRYKFAISQEKHFRQLTSIIRVAASLTKDESDQLLTTYIPIDHIELASLIIEISLEKRAAVAATHQHLLQTNGSLCTILSTLTVDQRYDFASNNKHLVKYASQLTDILRLLPLDKRYGFAVSKMDVIQDGIELTGDGSNLSGILQRLPKAKRYDFLLLNQDKIKDSRIVFRAMLTLPEAEQFAYAKTQKKMINEFSLVLAELKRERDPSYQKLQDLYDKVNVKEPSLIHRLFQPSNKAPAPGSNQRLAPGQY
jgi:hypothetical protein